MGRVAASICVIALLLLGFGAAQAQSRDHRLALVIGNAAYQVGPLRNPVNDARAMARTLRTLGFDVITAENASRSTMLDRLTDFRDKLTANSVGLVYYSGHGMQVRGQNYLIPIEAAFRGEFDVEEKAVSLASVLGRLEQAGNRLNLVILDACRDSPFERSFRATSPGLAQVDAPTGTLIAYSTAPGRTASDGPGANGLYTEAFLQAIKTPNLPIESLFKMVRAAVIERSHNTQRPWEASSLLGDFYFSGSAGGQPPIATAAAKPLAPPPAAVPPPAATAAAAPPPLSPIPAQPLPTRPPAGVVGNNDAALHCPAPGTTIKTSVGTSLAFTEGDGLVCHYVSGSGKKSARWAIVWEPNDALVAQGGDKLKALWPLQVGKAVQSIYTARGNQWFYTYTVTKKEQVTVLAGTFDTYVIERRHESGGHLSYNWYWYAPSIGYFVKHRFELRRGTVGSPPKDWEAVSVKSSS